MSWDYIVEKKFKALIKQITGTITEKDGDLVPYHHIKGTGHIWCYQVTTKTVVRLIRGIQIYILDMGSEEDEQCLGYTTDGIVFLIDKDEVEEIGFV